MGEPWRRLLLLVSCCRPVAEAALVPHRILGGCLAPKAG